MKLPKILMILLLLFESTGLNASSSESSWEKNLLFEQSLAGVASSGHDLEVMAKETQSDCVYQFSSTQDDRTIDIFIFVKATWVRDSLYYPDKGYSVTIRRFKNEIVGGQTRQLYPYKLLRLYDAIFRNELFSLPQKSPVDLDLEVNPVEVHARMFLNGKTVQIDRRLGESTPMSNVWQVIESLIGKGV